LIPTTELALHHILIEPEASVSERHPTVIMLHGLGADENDLAGLAQYLDSRLLTIAVRAPFSLEWGGYKWYDFLEMGKPEPRMFKESCDKLSRFIDDALLHYPIDRSQLYLLGFSMGTVMSLAMSLSTPQKFRGVIANSGYLAEGTHLDYRWNQLSTLSFFVAHGLYDQLIPVQASRIIKEKLDKVHARVEYHEYPMAHEIGQQSLNDMARWLTTQIDGGRD
jgi:phospholipase/carboxylesterase